MVQIGTNPPANAGDSGSIPGLIPWRRKWQPTPVFLPGESHGQRSLVGYRPWGCKELDMTERLTLSKPQPRDCFREEGPGVCRMQWPERKQARTQGCWGCWPARLPLSLWPEDEQSQIPALWCQLSWPCSQAVPEAGHVWAEGAASGSNPLPVWQSGSLASGSCWLCSAVSSKGAASHPLQPEREVARGSEWGRHCREGKGWLLGRNTSALWPGAVDRGLPAGRIIGLSTALPATPGMNYFGHTSQQKSTCCLLFLEWLLPTVPLATLWPVLPTPAWTEILSSKNSFLTLPWLYRVFSSCPRASST